MNAPKFIPLVGRAFLSAIFLRAGINNLLNFSSTQQMIAGRGLPLPALLLIGNILFCLVGGIFVLLGYKTRIGAILLILFLIPTTLIFHNFWADPSELTSFLQNLGLIGGLLILFYFGSGPLSLDSDTPER